ncbi:hypothetical protein [Pendulispora albinea]|uniref:Flp pilus-assembly TadG-like N-terminal domain-containing protein n=1 Tax=Pendulispora albinea TaxID=2741071 RepID=A0ABZ2LR44_9BACT
MSIVRKYARRARQRGFSHVSMTVEAAAVMAWFAVLVLGEKYVGDATSARRGAEDAVQQSSVQSAMNYCQGSANPSSAVQNLQSNLSVRPNGKLPASQIVSLIAGMGIGSEKTFPIYLEPFTGAFATSSVGGVTPHRLVGQGTHTFTGDRSMACLERPKDSPLPSINLYRTSIFGTTIRGYGPNP